MEINGKTKLLGIIGNPIEHTASPVMQNQALSKLNLNYVYVPLYVAPEDLKSAVEALRTLHFKGINVTVPYKQKVIPFLDKLDDTAKKIDAVNTIVNENGKLIGYNTDADGFVYSVEEELGFQFTDKRAVVIGAGGAAKAVVYSIAKSGAKSLTIANRTLEKAEALNKALRTWFPKIKTTEGVLSDEDWLVEELKKADIVINTTSIGMSPNENQSPINNYSWVQKNKVCCDIIYKPEKTQFLDRAQSQGAVVLSGAGMLAAQGILALNLFTGKTITYKEMLNYLRRNLC